VQIANKYIKKACKSVGTVFQSEHIESVKPEQFLNTGTTDRDTNEVEHW